MALFSKDRIEKHVVLGTPIPFLRMAFRPLFWLAALFGILSIAAWALSFTGNIAFFPYGGSFFWHTHEMLFGFTTAVIVGFLLTAVQSWTGVESINGLPLAVLITLWLLARLLLAFPSDDWLLITVALDLLFLPLSAIALAIPVVKSKMWKNLFFVPILLLMAVLNGLTHLSVAGILTLSTIHISNIMVLLVSLVMCIMGGRVFPMFTANGTGTRRVASIAWLEKLSIVSVVLSLLVTIHIIDTPDTFDAFIYLSAGALNFLRALRWRIWIAFSTPLVWSLHISYLAICIGFVMLSMVKFGLLENASLAIHAITVGGISFMILSMVSRVSLGHTGRIIQVGKLMVSAFILMGLSFVVRVFAPLVWNDYSAIILISAALWVIAYSLFLSNYTTILFTSGEKGQ